jgi:hypothetical protein
MFALRPEADIRAAFRTCQIRTFHPSAVYQSGVERD